jgi:hypothetical protein
LHRQAAILMILVLGTAIHQQQLDSIHDPGQAWNILTVGAYTNRRTEVNTDVIHCTFR